jgi:hypothetical protein
MITYRWNHWSAATNRKRSRTARGAVARLLGGLLAALALVTGMGTWTPSAEAASFGWAYLWADQPTAPSYTPSLAYQFNSSGATNTVVRTGVGRYTAKLPNLGSQTGQVQVTAYGTGSERCKVERWYPSGTTQQVNVRCFTSTGTPGGHPLHHDVRVGHQPRRITVLPHLIGDGHRVRHGQPTHLALVHADPGLSVQ